MVLIIVQHCNQAKHDTDLICFYSCHVSLDYGVVLLLILLIAMNLMNFLLFYATIFYRLYACHLQWNIINNLDSTFDALNHLKTLLSKCTIMI